MIFHRPTQRDCPGVRAARGRCGPCDPGQSLWIGLEKSWKIQKAELAEMMTRRSLSWKLSKALERSGASDPRVTVALLNIWPKSAVDQATVAPRAPAIRFPLPCLAPAHSGTFLF